MLIYKLCWCYIVNYCLRELHHPSLLFESMDTFSYWKVWQRDSLQNVLVRAKRKGCFRISQEDDHCVIVKTFLTGKSWHRDDFQRRDSKRKWEKSHGVDRSICSEVFIFETVTGMFTIYFFLGDQDGAM